MALQGVLRACREKSGHLAVLTKSIKEDQREAIPKTEILLYLDISQTEYFAMMQQIMGTMNAILPFDSISYDIDEFTNSKSMENFDVPPS